MDDILASIRRILNEDETAGTAAAPTGETEAEPLDLTESMLVQAAAPAAIPEPAPGAADQAAAEATAEAGLPAAALMAPAIAAATTAAVGKLLRTVAQERAATVHRGGPSIEDVVREEVRPLLKEWLDLHLPPLVERLVRVEVERVLGRALP